MTLPISAQFSVVESRTPGKISIQFTGSVSDFTSGLYHALTQTELREHMLVAFFAWAADNGHDIAAMQKKLGDKARIFTEKKPGQPG